MLLNVAHTLDELPVEFYQGISYGMTTFVATVTESVACEMTGTLNRVPNNCNKR
jgi:hypothetical protein